jgi:hypothetical protein
MRDGYAMRGRHGDLDQRRYVNCRPSHEIGVGLGRVESKSYGVFDLSEGFLE